MVQIFDFKLWETLQRMYWVVNSSQIDEKILVSLDEKSMLGVLAKICIIYQNAQKIMDRLESIFYVDGPVILDFSTVFRFFSWGPQPAGLADKLWNPVKFVAGPPTDVMWNMYNSTLFWKEIVEIDTRCHIDFKHLIMVSSIGVLYWNISYVFTGFMR